MTTAPHRQGIPFWEYFFKDTSFKLFSYVGIEVTNPWLVPMKLLSVQKIRQTLN
jgi:hypothetical protein